MEELERPDSQDTEVGREMEAGPKLEEIEPEEDEARPEVEEAEPKADGEQPEETEAQPQVEKTRRPANETPEKPMDRKSVLLWILIIVALSVAVAVLMGRPFLTYRALKTAPPGGKRDTLIRTLEKQGPVGTEFARRYVAGLFHEERASGAYILVRHQSLFHALLLSRVEKYLGEPDSRAGAFASYRVGEDRLLSIHVVDGVVQAIYLDSMSMGKSNAPSLEDPAPETED